MVRGLELAGVAVAILSIVIGVITMIAWQKMKHPLQLLRFVIVRASKLGLLVKPKSRAYMVEARVMLDGSLVAQIPVEVQATSRLAAKYTTAKRLTVSTGTEAFTIIGQFHKSSTVREVTLNLMLDGLKIAERPIKVRGYSRREAKFSITHRIKIKAGNAARKEDLIKYVRNERD